MSSYLVGVATREITPSADLIAAGRIFLWGYGHRANPSLTVRDAISARALAISDEDGATVILVALDICAIDAAFTQAIRARVQASRGISPEQIALNVSHTHNAPVTIAIPTWNPGVDRPDPDYLAFLADQIVAAIEEAIDSRQPATVSFARGRSTIGFNRHFRDDANAAYDRTLDVIRAAGADENVIAVAFFHGCHPVTLMLSDDISADFPGVARNVIEEAVGGTALFFQGYAGTINPAVNDVTATGRQLGQDVITLLRGPLDDLAGPVEGQLGEVAIPLQPLDAAQLEKARSEGGFNLKRWAESIRSLGNAVPTSLPTPLQALRVGVAPNEWRVIATAHEIVAEFAAPVRAIWPYARLSLMGYSNSQRSYLPTRSVLANPPCTFPFCNNYEGGVAFVWYGHRAPVTDEVDEIFLDANIQLLDPGWERIGDAMGIAAMTALNGKLFAATHDGKLWWRQAAGHDVPWRPMGHASDVVGMAALDGTLWAATEDGKLWRREPYGFDLPWEEVGHAVRVTAMTALHGRLWAATQDGKLWWREPVAEDAPWEEIGLAEGVVGLAASEGKLVAATRAGALCWREAVGRAAPWHRYGAAEGVVALTALEGRLFAAASGQLLAVSGQP
jgi:hypothetical protein